MTRTEELLTRRAAVVPAAVPRVTAASIVSGRGAIVVDADGRELIDFATGIGVMAVGHSQGPVLRAIREQAEKLQHTCIHVATYEPYVALCEKLATLFPHGDQTKVFLTNSGAEAVENAVKIARQATKRAGILTFTESFHGRTLLCLSLTSKVGYKSGCGPFAPEIYRLPFPNYYRHGDGLTLSAFVERELARLRQAFVNVVAPGNLAAVLIEVVQGEGGFVPAPFEYLRGLRRICDEHGVLLIIDEIQTGFCRTGRWAAYEHAGIRPDLSTWAKAMGGGLPIAAVVGRAEVLDACAPGTLGGTYGGNPVACAASLATIQVMEDEGLCERAVRIGNVLRDRFLDLQARCPLIGDVRGLGAMTAIELVLDGDPNKPATDVVKQLVDACEKRGLLIVPSGSYGNIVRILCPLVIPDEQLERGLDVLEGELLRLAYVEKEKGQPVRV